MLPRLVLAAAACLSVSLPGQSNAAGRHGNALSSVVTLERQEESALQEKALTIPTTSPTIRPVLGFALFVAVSTALLLLLRCIKSLTSSPKQTEGVSVRRLAGKDKGRDECKELEEALAGGGEGDDKSKQPPGTREEAAGPSRPRRSALPRGYTGKQLSADDVEDKIAEMENVTSLIGSAERGRGGGGRSLPSLLREGFDCHQRNLNVTFGPDVGQERIDVFKDLMTKLEQILGRHSSSLGQK